MVTVQGFPDSVPAKARKNVEDFIRVLSTVTLDEIVDEATRGNRDRPTTQTEAWEMVVNTLVSFTVVVNLLAMGLSIDIWPGGIGWYIQELVCAMIFIAEMFIKISMWGVCGYFNG